LHYFSPNKKLETHVVDCGEFKNCAFRLPKTAAFQQLQQEETSFVYRVELGMHLVEDG